MTDQLNPPVIETPDDVLALGRTINEQAERIKALTGDLENHKFFLSHVADCLREEAIDRDWCSEYDEFVNGVNRQCPIGVPGLLGLAREYQVSFRAVMTPSQASEMEAKIDRGLEELGQSACTNYETELA